MGSDAGAVGRYRPPSLFHRPATVLVVLGIACVVLGGLVAAVTDPLDLESGSWAAAYLVLVGGVAQVAMGAARIVLHPRAVGPVPGGQDGVAAGPVRDGWVQVAAWNGGNVGVIVGTLVDVPAIVAVASVPLVVALVIALRAAGTGARAVDDVGRSGRGPSDRTAHAPSDPGGGPPGHAAVPPLVDLGYRTILLVLAVSIPIGIVLSIVRDA
ncbi:MAG: hypothetical protein M0P31_17990 [Solirubrobacteraceae bacterium]|nr:hypothetical protein [Solirubrobacteraceae bacterium]